MGELAPLLNTQQREEGVKQRRMKCIEGGETARVTSRSEAPQRELESGKLWEAEKQMG